MIRLLDKTKISWFDYFYVFCIIIYAGKATVFARDLGDIRTIGNAFGLIITFVFYFHNRIRFNRYYFISILVFLLYATITSFNNHMINLFWISQWIIWLTIAYGLCQGLGSRLFVLVETVLFHLSIIALAFWIIELISPTTVEQIVRSLEFSKPYTEDGNVIGNMIVYTINKDYSDTAIVDFSVLSKRNPGFAWEPGAFASYLCLGMFCNIVRTELKIHKNYALCVFVITLLSTQSTTGLLTLILMMGVWLLVNKKIGWAIVVIPLAIAMFTLPFVGEKLLFEFDLVKYNDYTQSSGGAFGRTYSLMLDFQEFLRHPVLGLGGWKEGTWYAQHGYDFATISGIGGILSQYGAVMTLLFLILLIKSANCIKKITGSLNAYILIAVVLGMMYSYGNWTTSLYIAFWMFVAFYRRTWVINKLLV